METKSPKIAYVALFFVLWLFPHVSTATVLQGVHSTPGAYQNFTGMSQAFTGIDTLDSISVYVSRQDVNLTGVNGYKVFNILNVRCWDDSALTLPCPDTGLDGSSFVLWNYRDELNFINTSTNIPQIANRTIGQNATITVPFDAKIKMTIPVIASTTHNFDPGNYYEIGWSEVLFGADAFYFWGSQNDVYAPTAFSPATTTTPTFIRDMYFEFNEEQDSGSGLATTSTTQIPKNIEILNPTYGTTTATTTFDVSVRFRSLLSVTDIRPTTTRTVYITDALSDEVEWIATTTLEANASESLIWNLTATTSPGSKFIYALYTDPNGNVYSEVDSLFFNVATNTYFGATGLLTPDSSPSDLTQIDCSTFDVGCQFQKAITFLFIPPSNTLDKFSNLWQTIAEKRPFGYFTLVKDQLNELNVSNSPAFTLGTVPFMDSIFTPLRTLIASVLWGIFALWFFRNHLSKIDI